MTKEEIRKILDNTKVYVNGKSKEIQEKLFSFGYKWIESNSTKVCNEGKPFLLIYKEGEFNYAHDMCFFVQHRFREISADEILSLRVTEPSYRPFKTKDECWNEMRKHSPFGWVYHKFYESYEVLRLNISNEVDFKDLFIHYEFPDGIPFGILKN